MSGNPSDTLPDEGDMINGIGCMYQNPDLRERKPRVV